MKSLTLASLRKRAIFVASEVIPLFEIYSKLIYPHLKDCHLRNERSFALSKPSLFIKDEKGLFLVHNFELYNILKMIDITDEMLEHEVLYSEINADYFIFELAFYELIQLIARYPKLVNLGYAYETLDESLSPEVCDELFGKNSFPKSMFYNLINFPERTFYNRMKKN